MALLSLLVPLVSISLAQPPAEPWRVKADQMAAKAIDFLKSTQDQAAGGWAVPPKDQPRPHTPAITGLVLRGMLMQPGVDAKDPAVAAGVKYVLSFRKPDGGIYDTNLPSYNTAITLSMLAHVDTPEARAAIGPAQEYLKNLQWGTATPMGIGGKGGKESPPVITHDHAYYGGVGYGNNSRPDLSNLAFAIEAWHDSGLPTDDPAFQRAIVFLQRVQMAESFNGRKINEMPYAKGSRQGGFIYATGSNASTVGQGQSFAGTIEESMDDGSKVSRLRAYGSMTYAGFKSYIYAGLKADDPRVAAAHDWISRNYTLLENPHLGGDGYYYYLVMFARAMAARGEPTLTVAAGAPLRATLTFSGFKPDITEKQIRTWFEERGAPKINGVVMVPGAPGADRVAIVYFAGADELQKYRDALAREKNADPADAVLRQGNQRPFLGETSFPATRDWRADLVDCLAPLQNPDGSFKSIDDRWMENNPTLITAYALIALQSAVHPDKN